ncbi:hypothetical protein LXL04_002681 [Taraxacum kok-saghyz]
MATPSSNHPRADQTHSDSREKIPMCARVRCFPVSLCLSGTSSLKSITDLNPSVIILSGGPHSIHSPDAPSFPYGFVDYVEKNGVFVLGICYGLQLIVPKIGRRSCDWREAGVCHGDEAMKLPEGFKVVARSEQRVVAAVEYPNNKFYGLQYHPELFYYGISYGIVFCSGFATDISTEMEFVADARLATEICHGSVIRSYSTTEYLTELCSVAVLLRICLRNWNS